MGGVKGLAAMAYVLFELPKANILVGPENKNLTETKRKLFGQVGMDILAGPADSLILTDATADALVFTNDLVSQAPHGYNSRVCLTKDTRPLAENVLSLYQN